MTLKQVRSVFSAPWIAIVFGTIYVLSQAAITSIIDPIGAGSLFRMQCTFFSAANYLAFFGELRRCPNP